MTDCYTVETPPSSSSTSKDSLDDFQSMKNCKFLQSTIDSQANPMMNKDIKVRLFSSDFDRRLAYRSKINIFFAFSFVIYK